MHNWGKTWFSRNFVSFDIICSFLDSFLIFLIFSSELCGNNCWHLFVGVFYIKVEIIFGFWTFWTSWIFIEISEEFLNLIFLLFFMIKLSQFKLDLSLGIKVCVIANKVFKFVILHLKFSFEISQFVWIKWIKRNILYQMLTLKIFLFEIFCCFKIFLNFFLLFLLVRLFDFRFVLLSLFLLF